MARECNHVLTVKGDSYICKKCGDVFKLGDFADDKTEFPECPSGKCAGI